LEQMDKKNHEKLLKTGTTTVALKCKDGIVFAADRRASAWTFIAAKNVEKIHKIDDNIAMTIAGSVGDAQALVRWMRTMVKDYRIKEGRPMTIKAASTLLANVLFNYKLSPFWVQLIIGGYDSKPEIYNLDAVGGTTSEEFISTGSGSYLVYGVLESEYKKNQDLEDAMRLAIKSVQIAMKRDAATGDGIMLVTVTKDGYKEWTDDEIKRLMEKKKHR